MRGYARSVVREVAPHDRTQHHGTTTVGIIADARIGSSSSNNTTVSRKAGGHSKERHDGAMKRNSGERSPSSVKTAYCILADADEDVSH